ncbi:MAG TPA: DUF3352 domain-containing protein [Candidatus Limnocylindrales bacterium]
MDDETKPTATLAPPEPPAAPMPPVTPTAASLGGGAGRLRWIVAGAVVALAVAVTVGAMVLFGRSATPTALQYIPADAAIVGEIRMDLPGDQLQRLGNLLAHFPGFADQSTLSTKIDQSMKRLLNTGTSQAGIDYVADVKPWLSGPAFFAVMLPADGLSASSSEHGVISATTTATASCEPLFRGQTITHETYRGFDLSIGSSGLAACVLDGRQGLIGDPATVRLALDAKAAGTGMDRSASYAAAHAALGLDRLGTVYVSGDAYSKLLQTTGATPGAADLSALTGPLPAWAMLGVRAEDDALVVDSVSAPVVQPANGPSLLPLPPTHASVLAPIVPADSLVFVESQGAGVAMQNLLSRLQGLPELSSAFQMLNGVGGTSQLVGWIDDAGVAVSVHGAKTDAALLIVARDEASASSRVAALGSLLTLMGQSSGLEIKPTTINGTTVTTVTITDLGALIPPGAVPGLTIPASGPISFSIAAHGKVVIVTSGEEAMTAILNVAPGTSLADDATFKLAGQRGLANSRTTAYVAAGATIDLVQGLLPADQLATFKSGLLPYLDPLQSVSITTSEDSAATRSRFVISVTKP